MFLKDCKFQIDYKGSRFWDSIKEVLFTLFQIALSYDLFEILRVDNKDFNMNLLLGFLHMEKGELTLKFKNVEQKNKMKDLTNEILLKASGFK